MSYTYILIKGAVNEKHKIAYYKFLCLGSIIKL